MQLEVDIQDPDAIASVIEKARRSGEPFLFAFSNIEPSVWKEVWAKMYTPSAEEREQGYAALLQGRLRRLDDLLAKGRELELTKSVPD